MKRKNKSVPFYGVCPHTVQVELQILSSSISPVEQTKIQQTSYSTEISSKTDLSTRDKFMRCMQTLKETCQA